MGEKLIAEVPTTVLVEIFIDDEDETGILYVNGDLYDDVVIPTEDVDTAFNIVRAAVSYGLDHFYQQLPSHWRIG